MAVAVVKISPLAKVIGRKPFCKKYMFFISRFSSTQGSQGDERSNNRDNQTHFGYQTVSESEKQKKVDDVFSKVAGKYDVMNDVMSGGVHRLWKDYFIERMSPSSNTRLLDVAGGTGDVAFRFAKYVKTLQTDTDWSDYEFDIPNNIKAMDSNWDGEEDATAREDKESRLAPQVTVCDINENMLQVGRERAEKLGYTDISWIQGNAESLPFDANSFDVYTIAFGIRNCTHVDKVLSEANRVLRPGGRFMALEFSQVDNMLLRTLYDQYSFQVIPVLGQLVASDWHSYQYLVESIRQFPDQQGFRNLISQAGFHACTYENLMGGVAAIHSGFKF